VGGFLMLELKYSEAKKIIKLLHLMGWKKAKRGFYYKHWYQNDIKVSRVVSFMQVAMSRLPATHILNDYEANAHSALNKALERRTRFGRP
jgi:hypothetical protein